jgi:hypothetical protein
MRLNGLILTLTLLIIIYQCKRFVFINSVLIFTIFIISMTKLLDAEWLRGVQLFH